MELLGYVMAMLLGNLKFKFSNVAHIFGELDIFGELMHMICA